MERWKAMHALGVRVTASSMVRLGQARWNQRRPPARSKRCACPAPDDPSPFQQSLLQVFQRIEVEVVVSGDASSAPMPGTVWNSRSGSSVPDGRSSWFQRL